MHKLVVLYPTPDDPNHFREYYENTHLPLAASLPGMLAWRYSLSVHAVPESPYFAIFEADFPDGDSVGAALASTVGQAVQADVANYTTRGAVVIDYPVATT
ncbi:EthD family reductase [Gordonia polyisoprenivorans]|uniref:EthD family reductase n=1 Tax=Gordonia polyisoprenivorans TaxID=84595 RepID=UPI001AD64027|nr:EthD family reductase [Gordonia polyisoprenivorans]QTI69656.1 EthD family reductase [Gordonia polyisoprenivorans]